MLPSELAALLQAETPSAHDAAWQRFVHTHSRLLLHTARALHADYDATMDAYTYLLEQLKRDDYRRLRAYTPENRSTFPAWLVVVARRLCVDRLRERYGRGETRATRRRLADLLGDELNPTTTPDHHTPLPDAALRARELRDALAAALAHLAAPDQLLLKLRYEEQLSAREIGHLLHFPTPFHVYRRLQKVLDALKGALEQRGIDGFEP